VGLAIDYVLVWGALFLALIWLRLVVKEKPLRAQVDVPNANRCSMEPL